MLAFLGIAHVIMALLLILLVLLQDSKGGAMGMLGGGGGGANSLFGGSGAAPFLVKATRWVAIVFAATSIGLAYMTAQKDKSVLDSYTPPTTAPLEQPVEGMDSIPSDESTTKQTK